MTSDKSTQADDPRSVQSFVQVMGYQMMAEVAEALGKQGDATAMRAQLAKLRTSYTATYYNATTGKYGDDTAQ